MRGATKQVSCVLIFGVLCGACSRLKSSDPHNEDAGSVAAGEQVRVLKARLEQELGRDWKLEVKTGLQYGHEKHGFEIYGPNETLAFRPPGPKGRQHAYLHLYMHPLTISDAPVITQADGSLLSSVVGETDNYRVYGGVVAPGGGERILQAVREALGVRWGQAVNGLRCQLVKPAKPFVPGEGASITFVVQNVGIEPKEIVNAAYTPERIGFGFCLLDGSFGIDPPKPPTPENETQRTVVLESGQVIRRDVALDGWVVRDGGRSVTATVGQHSIVGFYCPGKPDRSGFHRDQVFSAPVTFQVEERAK
jgi:hypothetical protein